ncbi:hypothetical protein RHMOL_Rhmol01G0022800 [Rhododendron molle]|uniref:Uncharacterized protein n=1 Tax=Rhododendron molle TaxID=49168 RepID=A0ACC0PX03_RHOML|nr:hypothetical protein RHMOL_Rhmol01G0022800 [Rhododendron molle]
MLTLKASYTVKPLEPSPTGLIYLSDFDQSVALTHAPTVYFYRPISDHLLNPIEVLKNTLGKALTIFYPLAGRLQRTGRGRLAGSQLQLHGGAIFGNRVGERTVLKLEEDDLTPPRFDHLEFGKPPMLIGQTNNLEEQKKETTAVMLKLSKEQIQKLKKEANEFPTVYTSSKPFTRLPLCSVDFGWANEIYIAPGAIAFDGKSFIFPSRDEDGSFEAPFRLQHLKLKTNYNLSYLSLSLSRMLTLKASYTVKPLEPSPTGLIYLSDFDQSVAITHAPTVYFYRPISDHLLNLIEILKNSLGKALTIFYPLAGRLQRTGRGRLEVNCNSMGVLFLETESEAKISDFGDFTPTSETRALIPSVDYNKPIDELPLLLVQVTKFSCGGISLGLGISHVLADGRCAAHFVSEWARIARGEEPENLPFLDRTVLKLEEEDLTPPKFDHLEFGKPPMLIGQTNNLEEQKKETTVVMLKLSKEHIQKLKKEANEFPSVYTSSKPFTRYEAMTAHLWRCASKARLHEIEQLTSVRVPVDFHNRMVPPLPKHYFGNAVFPMRATTTSGELLSKPLGHGCSKIREAIETVTDEYVWSSLAYLKREKDLSKFRYSHVVGSTQASFLGNPNIAITSWIGLPLCGVDFGWGKEIYMGPGTIVFDGKSFIFPNRDEDGSFDAPFRLQVEHMDAFKKFFYENI